MPSRRILEVLKMTPAQWGALPPDVGEGKTNDRLLLREKAQKIMDEQDATAASLAGGHGGSDTVLLKRFENIEASIRGISNDIERRLNAIETRMGAMERGYAALEKGHGPTDKRVGDLEGELRAVQAEAKETDKRLKKLEK